jgi:hypothetical protein
MSAEQNHHEHDDDSPQLSPDQVERIIRSLDALEYFQVTLHHRELDEFRTVDMWSISMTEALSTATSEFERDGWHITAVARDCGDCTVPFVDNEQEYFDEQFDSIVRGESGQS